MRQILFVDDEPKVLQGLKRMLYNMRNEWDMEFAESGIEALNILDNKHYDVIISDMKMPGMDGARLLDEVKKRHPDIVRIVLSGQSDESEIIKLVGNIHQYLSKPCSNESVKSTVSRACALRDLLSNSRIKEVVSRISYLPSLPSLYLKLQAELRSPETSMKIVSDIISNDLSMSAKVLQLANSAFFGCYGHVATVDRAVKALGLKTISALVLSAHVFGQFDKESLRAFKIEKIINHCLSVSKYASAIATVEGCNQEEIDNAITAGLLHDVGKLVLSVNLPLKYSLVIENMEKEKCDCWWAEREIIQASHDEVGAYLLGLWGLSDDIIEAVAYHHTPDRCSHQVFSPLTAVHVANVFAITDYGNPIGNFHPSINIDYLKKMKMERKVEVWKQACKEARIKGN